MNISHLIVVFISSSLYATGSRIKKISYFSKSIKKTTINKGMRNNYSKKKDKEFNNRRAEAGWGAKAASDQRTVADAGREWAC